MTGGDTIDVADLPDVRPVAGRRRRRPAPAGDGEPAKAGTLREFKDNAERAFLVGKLRENGWNISKTAEVIDTPRSNCTRSSSSTRSRRRPTGRARRVAAS